ncbi:Cell division cycle-associated 7-like protein [Sciurus carolinensis]|uniref:Cell division cycle-associated 7-like protein n=1 Tax=Sciurus carolinensis TaxID=30640 RepID=A0AA41MQ86_SCICA|nr:Cell division cycle-associated 7-like protein [Sciurus carolinensis]
METLSSEESCDSFDSLEMGKQQDVRFRSKYFTEELRRIFIEDTDSENEDFEGFTQNDLNINSNPEVMLVESDSSDDGEASLVSEKEEEEEEEKITPRRGRSRRSSIGLRVALQFPTKKLAKTSDKNSSSELLFSSSHLQDSKKNLGRNKNCKQVKEMEDSASESEDESQESSDALLKRTMNIRENKAMLAQLLAELNSVPDFFPVRTPTSASKKKTVRRAFSEGQITRRTNPTRSARPPEKFALENFTISATKFAEEFYSFRRRKTTSGDWMCPPCRGICNCSYCRKRDGRCATGILIHLAKFYGYNNVKEYLER